MMCKLFFNFTCNRFQSKCISSFRAEIRTCFSPWTWAGLRHSKFLSWEIVNLQQMWVLKGEYELFFESVDLTLPKVRWQSAETPRWESWPPRQEECLSHTPSTCHTCTAFVFSPLSRRLYRRNTTCAMMIHVCTAHHRCQAQSTAHGTEQTHGKHSCVTFFLSFVLFFSFIRNIFLSFVTFFSFIRNFFLPFIRTFFFMRTFFFFHWFFFFSCFIRTFFFLFHSYLFFFLFHSHLFFLFHSYFFSCFIRTFFLFIRNFFFSFHS